MASAPDEEKMLHKTRLLTPGPTPIPDRVRLAMAREMIHHRKPDFTAIMARVNKGLAELFETSGPVITLAASGTGAMTAAVTNLFGPGDAVLVVRGGKFGARFGEIAEASGLAPHYIDVEWGKAVDPAAVQAALDENPSIRGVLVQYSETSTGVLHPVRALGHITAARDVLLVVDGISAVGLTPCPMDEWHIDCLLTGSQKGLMVPTGLAFIALSERAWQRAEATAHKPYYFDLPKERIKHAANQTRFSSPVSLIVALDESLAMMREYGYAQLFRKQWALTCMARAAAKAMGIAPLAKDRYTWGLTSLALPQPMNGGALLADMAARHGVIMAGGQDHLKGRIVRIGHMGWVDHADLLAGLAALADGYVRARGTLAGGDWVAPALAAYFAALDAPLDDIFDRL